MSPRLEGARVLLTRRRRDSVKLAGNIERQGGKVSIVPMTRIGPPGDPVAVEVARRAVADFDWIAVTSRHGAAGYLGDLSLPGEARPRVAAVGSATADTVRQNKWPVDLMAAGHGAAALAREMVDAGVGAGARVLYPCSDLARTELKQVLDEAGAEVVALEVYQTVPSADTEELHEECATVGRWHVAVFASPSAVTRFVDIGGDLDQIMEERLAVGIGPTTARALDRLGGWRVVESRSRDDAGLLEAVERAWSASQEGQRRRR
ncbi:MAG: uroporphyrinogen-III synthase [Deltaproteobacteria bacterium]|nr:uroporphyrinogen-III synthase [Deltaproteobacteria bacterium]